MSIEFKKDVMSTSGVKIKKLGKRPVASFLCKACGCEFEQNTKYCTEFKLGHYIMTEDGDIDAEYDAKAKCPSCGMEVSSTIVKFYEREIDERTGEVKPDPEDEEIIKAKLMEQIRNGPELKEKTPFEKICPKW